jgi:hypothetical protein
LNVTANGGDSITGIANLSLYLAPDGTPIITDLTGACRNIAPTQIAYSKLFQDSGVPVVNMGTAGGTLSNALTNYDTTYHPLTPIVTGHPAIFILHYDQDFANGDSATDYVSNMNAIITKFWADGAQVVVDMPTPYGGNAYYGDCDTQAAQARILLTAEAPFISSKNNSLLVDVDSLGSMNNPNNSNYYLQGGCCGHHPTDLWATTVANATVQAIQTNTNLIASDPVVGVNISPGLQYQSFIDPVSTEGAFWGMAVPSDSAIVNGMYGYLTLSGFPNASPSGGVHIANLSSIGTFEVTIQGGVDEGKTAGCYGFRTASVNTANLGCISFDDANNAFSFDGGTPNDHQGNIEAKNLKVGGSFNGSSAVGDTYFSTTGGILDTLHGNITADVLCQLQQGSGTVSAAPYWGPCSGGTAAFTLTTLGTSGAASYTGGVLNIPQYSGGGGGGITPVTVSGVNVNELDVTSCISPSYNDYQIRFDNLVLTAGLSVSWLIQFSSDNGLTWDTSSSYHAGRNYIGLDNGNAGRDVNLTGTGIAPSLAPTDTRSTGDAFSGVMTMLMPQVTTKKLVTMTNSNSYSGDGSSFYSDGGVMYSGTSSVNALRIILGSGGTMTGSVTCQPLAK